MLTLLGSARIGVRLLTVAGLLLPQGCGEDAPLAGDLPERDSGASGAGKDTPEANEDAGTGSSTPEGGEDEKQVPPQGAAEVEAWFEQGLYKSWRCEEDISPPRAGGVHGHTRVCWNDALTAAQQTPYPVGASLVKEIYTSDESPRGFAVNVKVKAGSGADTWYFYERVGSGAAVADGIGESLCAGCHSGSPNDFVFVRPL